MYVLEEMKNQTPRVRNLTLESGLGHSTRDTSIKPLPALPKSLFRLTKYQKSEYIINRNQKGFLVTL